MTEDFIDYCKKPIFFVSHFDRKRKDYESNLGSFKNNIQ